ncbi:hypothetical protein AB3N59_06310 [Leptospira sp. WS92.C1]
MWELLRFQDWWISAECRFSTEMWELLRFKIQEGPTAWIGETILPITLLENGFAVRVVGLRSQFFERVVQKI